MVRAVSRSATTSGLMHTVTLPLRLCALTVASWLCRYERQVIAYLLAENRALREQLGPGRLRFTDAQRRRLARAAKKLTRRTLLQLETLVTPDCAC